MVVETVKKPKRPRRTSERLDKALKTPIYMPYCPLCRLPKKERNELATMLFRRVPLAIISKRMNQTMTAISHHSTRCIPTLLERIRQGEAQSDVDFLEKLLRKDAEAMTALSDQMRDAASVGDAVRALEFAKELMDRVDGRALWLERMQANRDRQAADVIRMFAAQLVLREPIEGAKIVADTLHGKTALENLLKELEAQHDPSEDTD